MNFLQSAPISKLLLIFTTALSVLYFAATLFFFPIGNVFVFTLLILAGVYHVFQVIGYTHTLWPRRIQQQFQEDFHKPVAVFITVCGEPSEIIEDTVRAAQAMSYKSKKIYILNDGLVAGRDNWREAEEVAKKYKVICITRKQAGGAKAGNINHALKYTDEPFVVVFDADHAPHKDFLIKTMGYFVDEKVAFVQSPQYYKNHDLNMVTEGSWEQQTLFFGAIMKAKNQLNSVFMCGTNMVIRREALKEVGGMCETNIAEDFLTSLFVHEKKWKSVYVPEILAEGLAPEDFLSYYKQQFRWARGSLEIVFSYNPFFRKGLTSNQKIQYLTSASYYLSGVAVLINAVLPLLYFYSGLEPLRVGTMSLALIFLPYIFTVLYNLQQTSNYSYTFRALCFSISSFPIFLQALWKVITRQKSAFAVTAKKGLHGNYTYLVTPHLVYIALVLLGVLVGVLREGFTPSLVSNAAWATIYIAIFLPFITAARSNPAIQAEAKRSTVVQYTH